MTIRAARDGDYDRLCALFREADDLHATILPAYFRRPRRPGRPREAVARLVAAADEAILVADVDGAEAVALVHVQIYDTPPVATMVPKRRAHVDNLVVAEGLRRRGLGRKLLAAAEEWARTKGAEEVLLTVWAGNEAAEKFYAALGFRRVNSVLGRPL